MSVNGAIDNKRKLDFLLAAAISVAMVVLILLVQQYAASARVVVSAPPKADPIAVFPDFASIPNVNVKKQQFFDYLQDFILAENNDLANTRRQLLNYAAIVNTGVALSARERGWLLELVSTYRVETGLNSDKEIVDELLKRVDQIPVSLVLAQAANESAWGTSRFTLEGNNVFGQWCFEEGCGIVPRQRVSGATHEVRRFTSVESAVEAYFLNINSQRAYDYFRELRAYMREQKQELDSMVLAFGLGRYSQRGDHYVDEVQTLIIQNRLRSRDRG
ncbi:MAG: hypothetical protein COA96_01000 [SAR86 cluster bacterium]|uniref:Mannosyl-glycoprotein endo-beta-N-acetylglucosamidase-like domain-containing protein n=1 Tax=SAR86 cluster bacterium TaxID=2030880 RepID=A0A2A5BAE1_9GAMM|nr:MAG: hypothetical protein COA96_01000 [SAR86 cluster bacterium]